MRSRPESVDVAAPATAVLAGIVSGAWPLRVRDGGHARQPREAAAHDSRRSATDLDRPPAPRARPRHAARDLSAGVPLRSGGGTTPTVLREWVIRWATVHRVSSWLSQCDHGIDASGSDRRNDRGKDDERHGHQEDPRV